MLVGAAPGACALLDLRKELKDFYGEVRRIEVNEGEQGVFGGDKREARGFFPDVGVVDLCD
jgi:hypothetical protein